MTEPRQPCPKCGSEEYRWDNELMRYYCAEQCDFLTEYEALCWKYGLGLEPDIDGGTLVLRVVSLAPGEEGAHLARLRQDSEGA